MYGESAQRSEHEKPFISPLSLYTMLQTVPQAANLNRKNMKATREELIDFLTELSDLRTQSRNPYYLQQRALVLLKSINSEAGNETPTVTDNEAKKEVCQHCHGTKEYEQLDMYGRVVSRKRCPWC